jgi:hypothetical protein
VTGLHESSVWSTNWHHGFSTTVKLRAGIEVQTTEKAEGNVDEQMVNASSWSNNMPTNSSSFATPDKRASLLAPLKNSCPFQPLCQRKPLPSNVVLTSSPYKYEIASCKKRQ